MKAAVLYRPGDIRVIDVDPPRPGPGEVLIRVKACGVCGTDHSLYTGGYPANYPVVIGHEYSGVIEALGEGVTSLAIGERVTVDPNRVCHRCEYCRSGNEHLCENVSSQGVHCDGADAEYCVMPETNVYHIPDEVTFEMASFTEPLACAVRGIQMANIRPGDTVLVLGAGTMGNLLTQLASRSGAARIIVSEPIESRREIASQNGATDLIDPAHQDVQEELKKIRRIGADVVIEAAGSPGLQEQSIYYARRGGTIVYFGCAPQDRTIQLNGFYINDAELSIRGSYNNPFASQRAINLIASGSVRVDNLISHTIPLQDYLDVFRIWGSRGSLKLMVQIDT